MLFDVIERDATFVVLIDGAAIGPFSERAARQWLQGFGFTAAVDIAVHRERKRKGAFHIGAKSGEGGLMVGRPTFVLTLEPQHDGVDEIKALRFVLKCLRCITLRETHAEADLPMRVPVALPYQMIEILGLWLAWHGPDPANAAPETDVTEGTLMQRSIEPGSLQ